MNEFSKELSHASFGVQSDNSQASRCRDMWAKVVFNAVSEALWTGSPQNAKGYKSPGEFARMGADTWLRDCGADMRETCSNAGLDPDFISESYIAGRFNRGAMMCSDRAAEL